MATHDDTVTRSHAGLVSISATLPASLLAGITVVFIVLMLFTTIELTLFVHTPGVRWWHIVTIIMTSVVVVGIWMAREFRSTRYLQPRLDRPVRWFLHHLRRLPLVIVGFIVCVYGLRYVAFELFNSGYFLYFLSPSLLVYEVLKISMLFCCWQGLIFGFVSFMQMRMQTEHLLSAQKMLVEAKLTQLKAQLRPHFLFNTLNTISAFMQVDVARADRLLTLLGDLLRANLDSSERNLVALEEELRLLHQYADIMQARFGDRVRMQWDVAVDTPSVSVPAMLLQPLLENAFKHGVEKATTAQLIGVRIWREGQMLHVAIHNTGATLPDSLHEGWGLRNCRERLQLLYGANASLTLDNIAGGVEVKMTLPCGDID